MYTVMIVDDEMLARVGIKSMIPWEEHGFHVIGEAENGRKGLEMAQKLSPDIILTDIKMPIMDGISFMKQYKALGGEAKFIVLSSYDDFDIVKDSMKMGAEDYIIKLEMQPHALIEILRQAADKIEAEREENKRYLKQQKMYETNNKLMKDQLLKSLLFGWIFEDTEAEERLKDVHIHLNAEGIVCMVLQIDNLDVYNGYAEKDRKILDYAALNIIEEILEHFKTGSALSLNPTQYIIIFSCESESGQNDFIDKISNQMKTALKTYLNLSVSAGISNIHQGYLSIETAYLEAVQAVQACFFHPRGCTIMFSQHHDKLLKKEALEDDQTIQKTIQAIQSGNIDMIKQGFEQLYQLFEEFRWPTREMAKGFCFLLLFQVKSILETADSETLFRDIENCITSLDFHHWLKNVEQAIHSSLSAMPEASNLVLRMKQYIDRNYQHNITLEIISEHFHLSPNYLSNLFKRETGNTFVEYLTKVRIDHAKQLLKDTDKKMFEIGRAVGYENEYYFSRVFRKVAGIPPIQYKKSILSCHRQSI
ncbi:helix-turn-helix domain-containing protein [Paenibacillus faecalis]|uniref:helix-turn-helix domain-containing protein n=1 Tax=Paenibacillus faecalis TaxID=2079532 RepID=UPI000D0ECCEE|nr:helix-turn-helix domain-containing protein [Paenibacillus faecalis]